MSWSKPPLVATVTLYCSRLGWTVNVGDRDDSQTAESREHVALKLIVSLQQRLLLRPKALHHLLLRLRSWKDST
jgi:hypothetical protein